MKYPKMQSLVELFKKQEQTINAKKLHAHLTDTQVVHIVASMMGLSLGDELYDLIKQIKKQRTHEDFVATDLFTIIHELHHFFQKDWQDYQGDITEDQGERLYRWHVVEVITQMILLGRNEK